MEASKIKQYFLGENLSSLAPVVGKKLDIEIEASNQLIFLVT